MSATLADFTEYSSWKARRQALPFSHARWLGILDKIPNTIGHSLDTDHLFTIVYQ
jgi:hypothetical protein